MKRYMFNTLLLSLTVALMGCGGGSDDSTPAVPTITVSPESISAPADGGSYTINVTTNGDQWGAYRVFGDGQRRNRLLRFPLV